MPGVTASSPECQTRGTRRDSDPRVGHRRCPPRRDGFRPSRPPLRLYLHTVPLTLVTGPANSAKAGAVLGPLRDRIDDEPILVVPAFDDVEHSQRELAARGVVFGVRVMRSSALFRLIAARVGLTRRLASDLARTLIVERAVAGAHLTVLAESAGRPGFVRATARFVAELERSMVEPPRFTKALRSWAADGPRRAYAEEVAELYRRYRAGLDAAGLVDEELFAWQALDALRADPARWGSTPVFVYGFDDFTPLELDALETLAVRAGVDVTVSLPYEAGREAFRATARVREDLAAIADQVVALPPSDDHYAPGSRAALHALERGLFEPAPDQVDPDGAVRLHTAGGERAEIELCAAEVLGLLCGGTPPGEVAVILREPGAYASTLEQVFGAYGIPYSIDHSLMLAHTAVGRGLLACLRCACLDGSASDLFTYLRTPGLLGEPGLADRVEADVRRAGMLTAAEARAEWEAAVPAFRLDVLDRLAGAAGAGELPGALERLLAQLFAGPYRRAAHVLEGAQLDDARAFRAAHEAIRELEAHALGHAGLDARGVHDLLAEVGVRTGERPQPDRVQVASPTAVRARRFQAVVICGLQEGELPRAQPPEAFLPDSDRRAIAVASGLRLPLREERLERERYLFYVCASRAERELVLSCRYCDEEGNPQARSFFLDDVTAVFPALGRGERRRSLADVTWEPDEAPTAAEWERAVALRGPRRTPAPVGPLSSPAALAVLASRGTVSAGGLEKYAGCPVRWLVEDVLRPERIEPDSEPMVRGSLAHRVLELTFRRLRESTGARGVTPLNLAEAERILREAVREQRDGYRVAATDPRVLAAIGRLERDLLDTLRHEAEHGGEFEPEHLELCFGVGEEGHPAVELAGGLKVRGKIDRVDVLGRHALVRDYKSGRVDSYKEASWVRERRLQAPLYMLVVEELLGLEAAGGVYTPLRGSDRRSRGLVAAELADQVGAGVHSMDRRDQAAFAAGMERARGAIAEAAAGMREGRMHSCPRSCAYGGGCEHPSICRAEG